MDARAEIEAKRERLARLREQRQRLGTRLKSESPVAESPVPVVVPPASSEVAPPRPRPVLTTVTSTIYQAEPAIYYSKSTQTEDIVAEVPEIAEESFEEVTIEPTPVEPVAAPEPEFSMASPAECGHASEFLDRAWRIVARARDMDDPSTSVLDRGEASAPRLLRPVSGLRGPAATVSALAWLPQRPDVVVCAFREISDSINGQSHVYLWDLQAPSEPEYTLQSATDIVGLEFALSSPQLVFGAGTNGRLLAWDLRDSRHRFEVLPFQRSADDGHQFSVRALAAAGTSLVSCAEDGSFCVWAQDLLTRPQSKLQLAAGAGAPLDGLGPSAPTALAVHPGDNTQFLVGTLDGSLYRGFRVDSVTARAGISGDAFANGHAAGVTCVHFRQTARGIDAAAYMLSGGLDWAVRLWRVGLDGAGVCRATIFMDDSVSDVAFAPNHPSLFACACQNTVQLWDLNKSVDTAVCTEQFPWLVARIAWSASRKLAVGGVAGEVHVCEVDESLLEYDELSWSKFSDKF